MMSEQTVIQTSSTNADKSKLIDDFGQNEDLIKKANKILNRYSLSQVKFKVDRVELEVNQDEINSYIDFLVNGLFKDLSIDYKEKIASIQVTKNEQCYQFEIVDEKKDSFSIYSIKSIRQSHKFCITIYGYRHDVELSYGAKIRRSMFKGGNGLVINELRSLFNNDLSQLLTFLMNQAYNKND
ncbi:unnamed protein product [Brachionus calyciflorus]|uniref:Uncharacterized protein n=1 Tax=Brachionus calyciflorus TaxID=104777 RepID=A0A813NAV7_9BILA|nr:unnamed protein product [Brachionus calyciflorus]